MMDVEMLNVDRREAVLSDGTIIPLTGFLNESGDSCDLDDGPVVAIGGDEGIGWFAIVIAEFERVSVQ